MLHLVERSAKNQLPPLLWQWINCKMGNISLSLRRRKDSALDLKTKIKIKSFLIVIPLCIKVLTRSLSLLIVINWQGAQMTKKCVSWQVHVSNKGFSNTEHWSLSSHFFSLHRHNNSSSYKGWSFCGDWKEEVAYWQGTKKCVPDNINSMVWDRDHGE